MNPFRRGSRSRSALRRPPALLTAATAAALLLVVGGSAVPSSAAPTDVFTVTSTGDAADVSPDGICRTPGGECTLRAAIQEADRLTTHATIAFALPSAGPSTIAVTSLLPVLSNPAGTTIDGYTQPGARPNTDPVVDDAVIQVNIKGTGARGIEGLRIGSSGNVLRGLAIYAFRHSVLLDGKYSPTGEVGANRIVGSFLCTDSSGTYRAPGVYGGAAGIILTHHAHDNVVGAPTPADRNVISGCAHRGLTASFTGTSRNTVQNNIVGLSPDGRRNLGNRAHGLDVNYSANDNLIGGEGAFEHNVISGNSNEGVEVSHGNNNRRNRVIGNYIGTDLTGRAAPAYAANGQNPDNIAGYGVRLEGEHDCTPCAPNAGFIEVAHNIIVNNVKGGVVVDKGQQWDWVHDNWIGVLPDGTPAGNGAFGIRIEHGAVNNTFGPGNVIAHNGGPGIAVQANGVQPPEPEHIPTPYNRFTRNSVHDNDAALGIDLAPYGKVNAGGVGDPQVNHGIQVPVVQSASPSSISGTACAGCVVEVFRAQPSTRGTVRDVGQPSAYLGSTRADGSGRWSFSPSSSLAPGTPVTATATALSGVAAPAGVPSGATSSGDTSEAARNRTVA